VSMDASMWVADLGGRELWEGLWQGLDDFTLLRSECGRPASAGFHILSPPQRVRHLSNVCVCVCDHLTVN
jgi:hypothetical protein